MVRAVKAKDVVIGVALHTGGQGRPREETECSEASQQRFGQEGCTQRPSHRTELE